MKDIAQQLGLSVVTVSKVFRGHPDISEETRARVLDRLAQLNYRPNLAARSLATGRSFTIGFVAPDLIHPFFAEVAQHVAGAVRAAGYHLLMSSSREEASVEQEEIEHLLARRVDVLIVASTQADSAGMREIIERQVPLVLIDRKFTDLKANFIGVDDTLTGRIATQHLLEQKCKRIAYIGSWHASTSLGRLAGYRSALESAGQVYRAEYVVSRMQGDHLGEQSGYAAMRELLGRNPPPDGVFCNNDPTAMGAMKAILEHGLRIPQDIAIVGCGNVSYSEFLRVPLTSVDQDCPGLARRAAKLALELVSKPPTRPRTVLLEPKLVVRESSLRRTGRGK